MQDVVQSACAHTELGPDLRCSTAGLGEINRRTRMRASSCFFGRFDLQLLTVLLFGAAVGQATARLFALAEPVHTILKPIRAR